jgi:hypothetical protein
MNSPNRTEVVVSRLTSIASDVRFAHIGREGSDQTIADHLEHRQSFVIDHVRFDDRPQTALLRSGRAYIAEQRIDIGLGKIKVVAHCCTRS